MSPTSHDIVLVERFIERYRFAELLDGIRNAFFEPAAPQLHFLHALLLRLHRRYVNCRFGNAPNTRSWRGGAVTADESETESTSGPIRK